MGKILGSWSGMRKYLEQEMLAESLHGRIRYACTTYPNMDGCHLFELYIDKKLVKQFSLESVNSYFIKNGCKEISNPIGRMQYWNGFWQQLDASPIESRTEYTDDEFCDALYMYRHQDIQTSIRSANPLVLMFAILDRRVGKRTLANIESPIAKQPDWLKQIYALRKQADHLASLRTSSQ